MDMQRHGVAKKQVLEELVDSLKAILLLNLEKL